VLTGDIETLTADGNGLIFNIGALTFDVGALILDIGGLTFDVFGGEFSCSILNFNHLRENPPKMPFSASSRLQHRRCEIFVVLKTISSKAPFRSDIIGICRPDGAGILFGVWFYKYAAPTALDLRPCFCL
jgi:hypothetical protein